MIRFACPTCSAVYSVTDEKGGKTSTCTKCHNPFQIPDAPPPPPVPKAVPLKEKIIVEVEEEPVRSKPRRDDYDDERPRRRRREYDDEDDYDDRPRKKKKSTINGLAIGVGIAFIFMALLIGALAIIDANNFVSPTAKLDNVRRQQLPPEAKAQLNQIEAALVFLQVFIYGSILTALVWIGGGLGLILQQKFGQVVGIIAAGLSVLMVLALIVAVILLSTLETPKGTTNRTSVSSFVSGTVLRFGMHVLPVIVAASTLFLRPMQKLRSSF